MKTSNPKKNATKIALALSWDGARQPLASLPAKARTFLQAKGFSAPTPRAVAQLLAGDQVAEMRICWVPSVAGGENVLAEPFPAPGGRRVVFRAVKLSRFGDFLGVVYRR
jgi:hypothetical protein